MPGFETNPSGPTGGMWPLPNRRASNGYKLLLKVVAAVLRSSRTDDPDLRGSTVLWEDLGREIAAPILCVVRWTKVYGHSCSSTCIHDVPTSFEHELHRTWHVWPDGLD